MLFSCSVEYRATLSGTLFGQFLRRSSQNSPSTHSGEYGTVASPAGKNSWPLHLCLPVCEYGTSRRARKATATERRWRERTMPEVTKDRALLGALAVLVLVAFVAGCGLVPDQGQVRQEAKKKVEARKQQAKKEVKKEVTDLKKKVDDLQEKVEVAKEEVEKKVDNVQKDVNDLQKKVNELLKKIDAQQQQHQKEKK